MADQENVMDTERRLSKLIDDAVHAADIMLCDNVENDEELEYVTAEVAAKFVQKAGIPVRNRLYRKLFFPDELKDAAGS